MKTFNIYIDSRHKWIRVAPQLDQNDVIWAYNAAICKDLETGTFYLIDCYPIPESDMQDGKLTVADDVVFDRTLLRTLFQDYLSVVGAIEFNENVVEMLCDALNMTREEYEEGMFDNIPRLESLPNLDPLNIQFIIVGYGEEDNSTDKNKVLRTIATGQSDITRHEAYTKVTGLNEYNSLVPIYINFVDLGLPSGTLWAKMNVGAESETDTGLYFAWGETEGYTAEQVGVDKQFTWADYKFNPSGDGETFTKYTSSDETLELIDDAAAVNMGGLWHMPNEALIEELLAHTTHGFIDTTGQFIRFSKDIGGPTYGSGGDVTDSTTAFEGTAGYIFFEEDKSLSESISSGKYIFIPNNFSAYDGSIGARPSVEHEVCFYSNLADTDLSDCFDFNIVRDGNSTTRESGYFENFCPRCVGLPIRGVIGELESQGGNEGGNPR